MSADRFAIYPSLVGRSVWISGGTSGIGATLVEAFVRQRAQVAFVGRDRAAGEALVARLADGEPRPLFVAADVCDGDALRAAIDAAAGAHGPITVLVNNAGNDSRHAFDLLTLAGWNAVVAVNLTHQWLAAQAVAPGMRAVGGGSIVNLGSIGWKLKTPGYCAYAASKAAVHGLTRVLARELGADRIRVNTLTPGWVMTERQRRLWVDAAGLAERDRGQCLPGDLLADDIARMALFLAADDSRMCTAQEYVVDAGWS